MDTTKFNWNEKLKFSWGHIIAFVALIFISYVSYMGDFYHNGGDFKIAAIKVFIIDITILSTFIGAQILKGTDIKFDKAIKIERVLILLCPIAFICAMIPYNHYWNVFAERNNIEQLFSSSIEKSKNIFIDYDTYAKKRIENYDLHLSEIIKNKNNKLQIYKDAGFSEENESIRKENFVETLRLQLLSQNIDSLQTSALKWIDNSSQGASVWNAFLIGNIDKISDAIISWDKILTQISNFKMSNEANESQSFADNKYSYQQAIETLINLKKTYQKDSEISINTIWTAIILFLMLLFPYFLQKRNTKANGIYSLLPIKKAKIKNIAKAKEISEETQSLGNDNDIYIGTF